MTQPANFGGLSEEFLNQQNASIAILPVPYDGTSTWLKGASNGPAAIIDASTHMELYDIETATEVYRHGIHTDDPVVIGTSPEEVVDAVRKRVRAHLDEDRLVVTLGGEHSVSIGAIQAYKDKHPDLSVLQLDAHLDLRDKYENSPFNHACVMARVKELCPIVQVGIRSMCIKEEAAIEEERVFWAHEIYNSQDWITRVPPLLSDNVYITIDVDVFDPAFMPSTGTPEPGGLTWYHVLELLKVVCRERNVVGFDVVELCPSAQNRSPDFAMAKLIYQLLSCRYAQHE